MESIFEKHQTTTMMKPKPNQWLRMNDKVYHPLFSSSFLLLLFFFFSGSSHTTHTRNNQPIKTTTLMKRLSIFRHRQHYAWHMHALKKRKREKDSRMSDSKKKLIHILYCMRALLPTAIQKKKKKKLSMHCIIDRKKKIRKQKEIGKNQILRKKLLDENFFYFIIFCYTFHHYFKKKKFFDRWWRFESTDCSIYFGGGEEGMFQKFSKWCLNIIPSLRFNWSHACCTLFVIGFGPQLKTPTRSTFGKRKNEKRLVSEFRRKKNRKLIYISMFIL